MVALGLTIWRGLEASVCCNSLGTRALIVRPPDQMEASEQAVGMPHSLWTEPWACHGDFCILPKVNSVEPRSGSLWAELKCYMTPQACPPLSLFTFTPSVDDARGSPPLAAGCQLQTGTWHRLLPSTSTKIQ